MKIRLWVAILIPFMANAQLKPDSTGYYDANFNGVIAQVVDGAGWKTIITLVNLDTSPTTFSVDFYADNGSPMSIQTTAGTGSTITGTIPVGGSTTIESPGTQSSLSQGWGLLHTSNIAGGNAIFRQSVAGRPDFEASMPIVTYVNSSQYVLPFDQTTSTTGVALVNPLSYTSMTAFVSFFDEQGNRFLLDSLTLGPLQHTAFNLSDKFPASAGKRGVVEFTTTNVAMGLLGLRFGAQSFTSILPMRALGW